MQARNKARYKQLLLTVTALSLMTLRYVNSADLENQRKALNIISDFADRMCSRVPLEGETGELSGQAKADLSSILRQLVGLRVEIKGNAESKHYQGMLQEELAKAITESNDCRLAVLRELKSIIKLQSQEQPEPEVKQSGQKELPPPPPPQPQNRNQEVEGPMIAECIIGADKITIDEQQTRRLVTGHADTVGLLSSPPYNTFVGKGDSNCPVIMTRTVESYDRTSHPKFCISADGTVYVLFSRTKVGSCKVCDTAGVCYPMQLH